VQLLTIDDIALMIMRDVRLRQNLLNTYEYIVDELVDNEFAETDQSMVYQVMYEFKYLARTKSLIHTIDNTDFLEGLLTKLTTFYYKD
jgi:glutamyl-tRNA reductase